LKRQALSSAASVNDYLCRGLREPVQQGLSQQSNSEVQQYQTHDSSFMRRSQNQLFVDFAGMDAAIIRQAARKAKMDSLLLIDLPP
jgi:hypothetical protein